MNVTAIRESDWNKDDGTTVHVIEVTFDDGSKAPGYDLPEVPEIGKPLPEGWQVTRSKAGKPYIKVPKRGGGGGGGATAFRNTKEGQAFEQQQMNRRTALMQAIALNSSQGKTRDFQQTIYEAETFYAWLKSSPASGHTESTAGTTPLPRGNTAVGPSPGTSSLGEVGTDTTSSVGRVTPPASPDAHREGVPEVLGEGDQGTPHEHDLHPLRAGSKIMRCSVAGCGYTERRDA